MKLCGFEVGLNRPLFVIAGPCVVESRQLAFDTAGELKEITSMSLDKILKMDPLSRYPHLHESIRKEFERE